MCSLSESQMSYTELVEIYKLSQESENRLREAQSHELTAFTSVLLAVIGAGLAGVRLLNTDHVLQSVFMIIISFVTISLSIVAYKMYMYNFLRQVEYMTIEGKIEDILGLASSKKYHATNYWASESIVPNSYIRFRSTHSQSSDDFIKSMLKVKSREMRFYYFVYIAIGVLFFIIGFLNLFNIISLSVSIV